MGPIVSWGKEENISTLSARSTGRMHNAAENHHNLQWTGTSPTVAIACIIQPDFRGFCGSNININEPRSIRMGRCVTCESGTSPIYSIQPLASWLTLCV